MKKKILLIQPTPYDQYGKLVKKSRLYFVGLALPLLAALTPEDFTVEICYETIEEVPFDTDAELIGISSISPFRADTDPLRRIPCSVSM